MKVIIIRHGETIEEVKGILQGHLDGNLSELGEEQVKRVAERLKDEKIDFIYSSDLARVVDTAKEIAKFHTNSPIKFVKELRERYKGEFQGKRRSDYFIIMLSLFKIFLDNKRGIETNKKMYERAKRFLNEIIKKHYNDNVLFVCHGAVGKALICVITNKPAKDIPKIENLHNTSVSIYDINENMSHNISLFNCIKHLLVR